MAALILFVIIVIIIIIIIIIFIFSYVQVPFIHLFIGMPVYSEFDIL